MNSSQPPPPARLTALQGSLTGGSALAIAVFSTRNDAPSSAIDWVILGGAAILLAASVTVGYRASRRNKTLIDRQEASLRKESIRFDTAAGQAEIHKTESAQLLSRVTVAAGPEIDVLHRIRDLLGDAIQIASQDSPARQREIIGSLRGEIVNMLSGHGLRTAFLSLNGGAEMLNPRGWGRERPKDLVSNKRFVEAARELLKEQRPEFFRVPENASIHHPLIPAQGYCAFLRAPVFVGRRGYGLLYVDGVKPESLADFHLILAETLAPILGTGLRLAEERSAENSD